MSSLITNATIQIRQDTAGNWTSTNPTPAAGEWCREIDTGALKQGDGSTAWNDLEYRQQLPFTNDLTSANITHTLPVITGFPQTEAIYWENGGTYKLTLAVTDSETVGGISAGTWEGEGEGHMIVESDGTNWQVREYEDSGTIADSGNNSDRIYSKKSDGTMICIGVLSKSISIATGATLGGFRSGGGSSLLTYAKTFNAIPANINMTVKNNSAIGSVRTGTSETTSIGSVIFTAITTQGSATRTIMYEATGRWRT